MAGCWIQPGWDGSATCTVCSPRRVAVWDRAPYAVKLQLLGRREQICACTCCICSGYEQEAYLNAACRLYRAVLVMSVQEEAVGKGECSYLLLVPLECQEFSCIPVICWESLSTAPGLPLSIAPLASPRPLERNSMEIEKPPKCICLPKAFLPPFQGKLRGWGAWLAASAGAQHPTALSTVSPGVLQEDAG